MTVYMLLRVLFGLLFGCEEVWVGWALRSVLGVLLWTDGLSCVLRSCFFDVLSWRSMGRNMSDMF